jgi:hypothetical protein
MSRRHGPSHRQTFALRHDLPTALRLCAAACLLLLAGCSHGNDGASPDAGPPFVGLPRTQLLDPKVCGTCHADHYSDWVASMHAQAADDPVFIAMNARGQRETDGGLGTFCVNCHAPMAVRDGMTTDGLNLASLPAQYHGVTCFFCHSISSVDGTHNAAVVLANDLVMRGEITDAVPNSAHLAKYSTFQDETSADSASACGACHDIVVPPGFADDAGAHIERTFAEWQTSAFSALPQGETCAASGCHMVRSGDPRLIAQQTGYGTTPPLRYFHAHGFPAIDVNLVPGSDAAVIESPGVQALLANALQGDLCVTAAGGIRVVLDTPNLGHDFPSGAAQDRRFWAQIVAYQGTETVYQSGVVPFGSPAFDAQADPDLWLMRDCIFGPQGNEVHMFWQAASYDGNELPALTTFDHLNAAFFATMKTQFFPRGGTPLPTGRPDRVTLDLWVQPVGTDVLDDLVDSGDLNPSVAAAMPTFPVPLAVQIPDSGASTELVWTVANAADSGVQAFADSYDQTITTCVGSLPVPTANNPAPGHKMCSP